MLFTGCTVWIHVHRRVQQGAYFLFVTHGEAQRDSSWWVKWPISASLYAVKLLFSSSPVIIINLSALCHCSGDTRRRGYFPPMRAPHQGALLNDWSSCRLSARALSPCGLCWAKVLTFVTDFSPIQIALCLVQGHLALKRFERQHTDWFIPCYTQNTPRIS